MAQSYISVTQIKELKDIVKAVNDIQRDLYNLITSLEVRVSENGNRPAKIRPYQMWHDKLNGQVFMYIGDNSDIMLG